jgi:hypothetical protein
VDPGDGKGEADDDGGVGNGEPPEAGVLKGVGDDGAAGAGNDGPDEGGADAANGVAAAPVSAAFDPATTAAHDSKAAGRAGGVGVAVGCQPPG